MLSSMWAMMSWQTWGPACCLLHRVGQKSIHLAMSRVRSRVCNDTRVIACHTRVSMEFTWLPVLGNRKPQCFHSRTCQKQTLIYSRSRPDRALHTRPPTHSRCRPSVREAPLADSSLSFDAHCRCHTLRKHPCVGCLYKFEGSPQSLPL